MEEVTNEQKLYVLLLGTYNKTNQEEYIWSVIKSRYSKDSSWFIEAAKNLDKDGYVSYRCGIESGSQWAATALGRQQILFLWNGSELKRQHNKEVKALKEESLFENRHKKLDKFLWILVTAITSSVITMIVTFLLSQLCRK